MVRNVILVGVHRLVLARSHCHRQQRHRQLLISLPVRGVAFTHQRSDQDSDFSLFLINPTIAQNQSRETSINTNSIFFARGHEL